MAVEVSPLNVLGGGSLGVASFSDTLAVAPSGPRNIISPPSEDWMYIPLGGDTPTAGAALPTFTFGNVLSGGGGTGLIIGDVSYAFTTYSFAAGIMPVVMGIGSLFYKAKQKFVQITFNNFSLETASIGMGNYIDASGTGVAGQSAICHDAYTLDIGGTLQRWNSGATNTVLVAGFSPVQGDVLRLSVDFTNPAQATIVVKRNGVTQSTTNDVSGNRLTGLAFPFIQANSFGAAPTSGWKNFSCGIGL
jgi:hypothetical protein